MSWHLEALPPEALAMISRLAALPALRDFYLAGGTALALRRGHRVSVDLDFFSAREALQEGGRQRLKERLSPLQGFRVREEKEGTLHVLLGGMEISFLRYRYPLLRRVGLWKGLRIASLHDIGLMKIGAIIGRGSRKDFRDLREIAREVPIERLLRLAPRKFPDSEDFLFQASKALVYFEDAEAEPEPRLLRREPWEEIKRFFAKEVPRVFRRLMR